ncbi:hypothetical protein SDC9_181221 [bioreactor metagenome]|uniref:Uncharacterized protein n=1 Tax=bioreactor metagenome TaxID=1076179 RepID=A0A645H4X2_9ZZZZ
MLTIGPIGDNTPLAIIISKIKSNKGVSNFPILSISDEGLKTNTNVIKKYIIITGSIFTFGNSGRTLNS